jgi:hypothetical protein
LPGAKHQPAAPAIGKSALVAVDLDIILRLFVLLEQQQRSAGNGQRGKKREQGFQHLHDKETSFKKIRQIMRQKMETKIMPKKLRERMKTFVRVV